MVPEKLTSEKAEIDFQNEQNLKTLIVVYFENDFNMEETGREFHR